jgi:copper(I)-binding protein
MGASMKCLGLLAPFLVTVLVVLLAGCSSAPSTSPDPLFSRSRIGLDSVDGQVGRLRLLSVAIASPGSRGSLHLAGDSAGLFLTIANDGRSPDVLTGVSAEPADAVVLRNGEGAATSRWDIAIAPGGVAVLRELTGPHLELSALTEPLRSGFSIPVTFRFRDAGPLTLEVPIRTYTDVRPDKYVDDSP